MAATDDIQLGNILTGTGLLSVTAVGITQKAASTISALGSAVFNGGTGAVTLDNIGNAFGSVGATGDAVTLRESGSGMALDSINAATLTVNAGGAVTQNSGSITVTGAASVTADAGGINLGTATNDFGSAPT